jgi:hypothetical protein
LPDLSDPKQHDWRQGATVSVRMPGFSFADYKTDPPLREQDVLLVICHDCDICCQEPEEEPTFECVPARQIAEAEVDGLLAGKSPRRLQLRLGDGEVYALRANERLLLPRHLFEQADYDGQALSPQNLKVLRRWLHRRYDRTSLPTELVDRMRKVDSVLHRKLKAHGDPVCSVWLTVDPESELEKDESYTVGVYFAMQVEEHAKPDKLRQTLQAAASVNAALAKCDGIHSEGVKVVSEEDISLDDLHELIRWDLEDYLSYRVDDSNLTPQA